MSDPLIKIVALVIDSPRGACYRIALVERSWSTPLPTYQEAQKAFGVSISEDWRSKGAYPDLESAQDFLESLVRVFGSGRVIIRETLRITIRVHKQIVEKTVTLV